MLVSQAVVINWLCLLALLMAQALGETCYSYRGTPSYDQVKCNGSEVCCGAASQCMPNRLCKNEGTANNVLIRGPCRAKPYDKNLCAQICVFDEIQDNTGFDDDTFPRVEICGDGVYCCRKGNEPCCGRGSATRVSLDSNGILISGLATTTSSTGSTSFLSTTVSSTTSIDSTSTQNTASIDSTPTQNTAPVDSGSESGNNESLALEVGLGVSIPSAALIAALATWFFLRKRQGENKQNADLSAAMSKERVFSGPIQASEVRQMTSRSAEGHWATSPQELVGTELYQPQTQVH